MIKTIISIDLNKTAMEETRPIFHNRWHPDIPPIAFVKPGEAFKVECFDFSGGQMKNDDDSVDLKNMDLSVAHVLSGPIEVEGAEPGDALEVELLDIQPFPERCWGVTAILDPNNGGGGFMGDLMKGPCKAIWDFEGIYATSRHIPGVKFVGIIHPGIVGTAPSHELLHEWNTRELELINSEPNRNPPFAFPPSAVGAMVGSLKGPLAQKVKEEGARTAPSREHGGNCDIKNLSRGAKIWLPVYVPGANVSFGDIHFSQGDGEIAFCGAIETSGIVTAKVQVIKNGIKLFAMKNPIFLPGPVEPRYNKYLTFEGIAVDDNGKQHFLDPRVSFRQACLNAMAYLQKLGYTKEQAYLLLSAAPCEGRINNIVDVPNSCCSIGIPSEIFDFDILPKHGGHEAVSRGQVATLSKNK